MRIEDEMRIEECMVRVDHNNLDIQADAALQENN